MCRESLLVRKTFIFIQNCTSVWVFLSEIHSQRVEKCYTGQKLKKKLSPRRKHIRKKEPGNGWSHYYHVKNCFFHFSKVDHTRKSLFLSYLSDNEAYRNVVMNNEFDISLSRYQFKRVVFTIFCWIISIFTKTFKIEFDIFSRCNAIRRAIVQILTRVNQKVQSFYERKL